MARDRRSIAILLLEDNESLGEVGDIVEVRPGYARNYLFRAGIATLPTADALRRVERAKKDAVRHRLERSERLAESARALEGLSITLEQRASEEGHLFGSVGISTIIEALAEKGIAVEEKQVLLESPIKELGIFNVPIRLDADAGAEIRVWVVEPGE